MIQLTKRLTRSRLMTRPFPRRASSERGQVVVIVGVGLIAIIGLVGLVIDGGYAWGKQRDTQNAADSASEAGATVLVQNLVGVSPAKTDGDVLTAVDQAATENGTTLTIAYYTSIDGTLVDASGAPTANEASAAVVGDGAIPPDAKGVRAVAEQSFAPFIAKIFGFNQFTARAPATAVSGYLESTCAATAGCIVLPITFPTTIIDCDGSNSIVQQTPQSNWPAPSDVLLIPLCSNGPGNVGWLDWTPTAGGASELDAAIRNPSSPPLSWPDWYYITSTGGVDSVEDAMRTWNGKVVQIPLFDLTCSDAPSGPGLSDCPAGSVGGNGSQQWYHIGAMTSFELCGPTIPECVAAGYGNGAYIQGSNGSVCATGNGATDCLAGRFVRTSYSGQVTALPGSDPENQTVGVQLIR